MVCVGMLSGEIAGLVHTQLLFDTCETWANYPVAGRLGWNWQTRTVLTVGRGKSVFRQLHYGQNPTFPTKILDSFQKLKNHHLASHHRFDDYRGR